MTSCPGPDSGVKVKSMVLLNGSEVVIWSPWLYYGHKNIYLCMHSSSRSSPIGDICIGFVRCYLRRRTYKVRESFWMGRYCSGMTTNAGRLRNSSNMLTSQKIHIYLKTALSVFISCRCRFYWFPDVTYCSSKSSFLLNHNFIAMEFIISWKRGSSRISDQRRPLYFEGVP